MSNRNLLHLNINLKNSKNFTNIKFVCMGGCATRMKIFAFKFSEYSNIPLSEEYNCGKRYVLYMVGPILFVNHGIGMPSINILLHEITILLNHAGAKDYTYLRIGSCGGIDVDPGTVVVSSVAINTNLRPFYEINVLGNIMKRKTFADTTVIDELVNIKNKNFNTISGKTLCTNDFYEEQLRIDGAICKIDKKRIQKYLNILKQYGIVNIEMESLAFYGFCNELNIKSAVICVVLVNRFNNKRNDTDYDIYPQILAIKYMCDKLLDYKLLDKKQCKNIVDHFTKEV